MSSIPEAEAGAPGLDHPSAAGRELLLASVWLRRERSDLALAHLARIPEDDANYPEAVRWSAYCAVAEDRLEAAVVALERALDLGCRHVALPRELAELRQVAGTPAPSPLPDRGGPLRLRDLYRGDHHRSGWHHATAALATLHGREGVRFEHFVEEPFAWMRPGNGRRRGYELLRALRNPTWRRRLTSEELGIVPIDEPWIGVFHNPPGMPCWFHPGESPQAILGSDVWRRSAPRCLGLIALSEHLARWLRDATGKPVSSLVLPSMIPERLFDPGQLEDGSPRTVVQVGWWLRRLSAIHRLPFGEPGSGERKIWLLPRFAFDSERYVRELRLRQISEEGGETTTASGSVEEVDHLSDEDYDRLLSTSVVLLDLYDASANNTVAECIARGTPLLVNRLPAVEESLGGDYPLYYEDYEQAARFARDDGRLAAAHHHLLECPTRRRLDIDTFLRDLQASEVFGLL